MNRLLLLLYLLSIFTHPPTHSERRQRVYTYRAFTFNRSSKHPLHSGR